MAVQVAETRLIIIWGVRCDQSESWIAVEYIMYSTVIQSETARSKGVELNCDILGSKLLMLRLQVAGLGHV